MKILVTGANGYLGQGIVKHILDCGNEVVAADFKVDHIDERATRIPCDLFSIEDPLKFVKSITCNFLQSSNICEKLFIIELVNFDKFKYFNE